MAVRLLQLLLHFTGAPRGAVPPRASGALGLALARTLASAATETMPGGPLHRSVRGRLLADIRFPVYSLSVEWEIEGTDEFFAWAETLERSDAEARDMLDAVIDMLAEKGPMMRRPYVGEIVTSRHHNMKELLVPAGTMELRVLFCFALERLV
jgi:hypothetical protein